MDLTLLRRGAEPGRLPLVLLHGWGHNSRIWQDWLAQYPSGRPIYAIDLPGFAGADTQLSPQDAAQVLGLSDTLSRLEALLPTGCVLLGWSLGGMLACQLASSPKVKGLITLAANPSFIARPHWPEALEAEVLANFHSSFAQDPNATLQRFSQLQAQGHPNRKALLAQVKALAPALHINAWAEALSWLGQIDNSTVLAGLNKPQRHLFAEQDALVPSKAAEQCPHSRVIPGGHLIPLAGAAFINQALAELDRAQNRSIAHAFSRAAAHYDQYALLQQRLGRELLDHIQPQHNLILDLGCGTGFIARELQALQPASWVANLDLAWGMLQTLPAAAPKLQADAEQLPFATGAFNAITANLALQWCHLPSVLAEAKRCLAPGGLLIFNTLMDGTLGGLARAWAEVDHYPHINPFPSQAHILAQCQGAGFSQLHWQAATHTITAPSLKALLMGLKGIGAKNQQPQRYQGLMSPRHWRAFSDAMGKYGWDGHNWFVTYEVLTLCLQA